MNTNAASAGQSTRAFRGFAPLTGNFIYCPNQFFDVCLPNGSRGVVRLVAYLLRKTLGYLDANGNPVRQDIRISYTDLARYAGVSTRAIPRALVEAESGGYILCVTRGVANGRGRRGQAAEYRLRWSGEGTDYTIEPERFDGFFAGEGHRSPIPNGYFDVVVRRETLGEAKVVGTVLRHTVGYQNQFGGRRSSAPLAFSYIQRFAKIGDRTTISKALKESVAKGYIHRVAEGYCDPSAGQRSRPAKYAIRWLDGATKGSHAAKTLPVSSEDGKNPTEKTARSLPAEHGTNPTHEKTELKRTQQQSELGDSSPAAVKHTQCYQLLRAEGFDAMASSLLSRLRPVDEIRQQIEWIDLRNPRGNRLGLLRKAIEEGWSEPAGVAPRREQEATNERQKRRDVEREAREEEAVRRKRERIAYREALLVAWRICSHHEQSKFRQKAIDKATSETVRRSLRRCHDLDDPPMDVLLWMARDSAVSIGESS